MEERMQVTKFKSECLKVMDKVKKTRKHLVITKRSIPVVKIIPLDATDTMGFGLLKGTVLIKSDIFSPIDDIWNACS